MELKDELIGRVRELKPMIAARAAATEKNRALLDDTVKQLCDTGIMQILTPKRYGGHELHMDTVSEITRTLASACVSTGWVTSFYMGHNFFFAQFPERAQDEIWANGPYTLMSGQLAPTARAVPVPGGYQVTALQSWSSGVLHSDWVLFSGLVMKDGENPEGRYFSIPREQVEVVDNWSIAGMCGTGSHDVRVEDVFVPEHQTVVLSDFIAGQAPGSFVHENPMYKLPGTVMKYIETMAVLSGAFRGAAEGYREITKDRIVSYTGANAATKPATHLRLGTAFARLDAVDDLVDATCARVMRFSGKKSMSVEERAAYRSRVGVIVQMSADGVSDIMQGAGGNAFRNSSALQRFFRDVNTLRTHAVLDFDTAIEMRGRVELGMEPGAIV